MSDPLDYMNEFSRWKEPPPYSEGWIQALAKACNRISERDDELARKCGEIVLLKAQIRELKRKYKKRKPNPPESPQ